MPNPRGSMKPLMTTWAFNLRCAGNGWNKVNCLSALGEWFFRGYYVVERHWSCYHCLLNHPIE